MKRFIFLLVLLFLSIISIFGQAPGRFNYQAVARNTGGDLIINQNISVRISILTGSTTGTTEFSETHSVTTDAYGVFNLLVGGGTVVSGSFDAITWGTESKFLKIEADVTGGTDYQVLATTQILSTPYALYANKAGNVFSGDYNDLANKPVLSVSNDTVSLTGGSYGVLPKTYNDNEFRVIYAGGIADNPITAPSAVLAGMGAGSVDIGVHDYKITFITSAGETGAGPPSSAVTVADNIVNGKILISSIPTSGNVTARNIYRRFNSTGDYKLLTTINDNSTTTYIDNIENASLGKILPESNSTTNGFQFDASGLTQNQTLTIPNTSGTLVVNEGTSVPVETKTDRSLVLHGRSVISQLINGTNIFSAEGGEWGEAYIDENGRNNSVNTGFETTAFFDLDKFATFKENVYFIIEASSVIDINDFSMNNCKIYEIETGKWGIYCTPGTDEEKRAKIYKTLFYGNVEPSYGSYYKDPLILNFSEVVSIKISVNRDINKKVYYERFYAYYDDANEIGFVDVSASFTGTTGNNNSTWANLWITSGDGTNTVKGFNGITLFSLSDTNIPHIEFGTDQTSDEVNNPTSIGVSNLRAFHGEVAHLRYLILTEATNLTWNYTKTPTDFEEISFTNDYSIPALTTVNGEILPSLITHNISPGTFSSNISSVFGTALIAELEEGSMIQFKLTNDTEDSGWLNINEPTTFIPFTSQPTKVIVKLIPKAENPTPGIPSIYGFYITEF